MMEKIDFRSDTVTWPTTAMRHAMAETPVGDDVYGDDPTVNRLEKDAASLLGKEAALFVCSGTMGNQLAIMSFVARGEEIILADQSHIVWHEAGAAAYLAGAQLRCIQADAHGQMDLDLVEATIRQHPEDIHSPRTALICLENADGMGRVLPLSYMAEMKNLAEKHHIPVHLDGARLFNAAAALQTPPDQIASYADTVQICLSKGLCAPAGSLLAGSASVINQARRFRKMLGGGMRQTGVLAAPGLIALHDMRLRLHEDHVHASWLAEQLQARSTWFNVHAEPQINMVFFSLKNYPVTADQLPVRLAEKGILINPADNDLFRLVTHYWIGQESLNAFIQAIDQIADGCQITDS